MTEYVLTVRVPIFKKNGNFSHFGISKHMSRQQELTKKQQERGWRILEIREMNSDIDHVKLTSINLINLN